MVFNIYHSKVIEEQTKNTNKQQCIYIILNENKYAWQIYDDCCCIIVKVKNKQ